MGRCLGIGRLVRGFWRGTIDWEGWVFDVGLLNMFCFGLDDAARLRVHLEQRVPSLLVRMYLIPRLTPVFAH